MGAAYSVGDRVTINGHKTGVIKSHTPAKNFGGTEPIPPEVGATPAYYTVTLDNGINIKVYDPNVTDREIKNANYLSVAEIRQYKITGKAKGGGGRKKRTNRRRKNKKTKRERRKKSKNKC